MVHGKECGKILGAELDIARIDQNPEAAVAAIATKGNFLCETGAQELKHVLTV